MLRIFCFWSFYNLIYNYRQINELLFFIKNKKYI